LLKCAFGEQTLLGHAVRYEDLMASVGKEPGILCGLEVHKAISPVGNGIHDSLTWSSILRHIDQVVSVGEPMRIEGVHEAANREARRKVGDHQGGNGNFFIGAFLPGSLAL
jgi:hypothetical protein